CAAARLSGQHLTGLSVLRVITFACLVVGLLHPTLFLCRPISKSKPTYSLMRVTCTSMASTFQTPAGCTLPRSITIILIRMKWIGSFFQAGFRRVLWYGG